MQNKTLVGILAVGVLIVVVVIAGLYYGGMNKGASVSVTNFEECVAAGNAVMESSPRQCRSADGKLFVEILPDVNKDVLSVTFPDLSKPIKSPFTVRGEARGNWFFEASFPIRILDENGQELGVGIAQAQGEWMTTNFVSFEAPIVFKKPPTVTGSMVLEKDNPSGLPEHDARVVIPVIFEGASAPITGSCQPTGCSGQICSDQDVVSTCEYREEYACYQKATCARQANGACGWNQTTELIACIQAK